MKASSHGPCKQGSKKLEPESVAQAVLDQYASLPKTGKPQQHEHTVLAGIVAAKDEPFEGLQQLSVLSIGTGTKCLGASQRSLLGQTVNDSHAEVIARRALVRWIYSDIQDGLAGPAANAKTSKHESSWFWSRAPDGRFQMAPGISLHMFISQAPCGDACIYSAPLHDREKVPTSLANNTPQAGHGARSGAKPKVKRQLMTAQPGQTGAKALYAARNLAGPANAMVHDSSRGPVEVPHDSGPKQPDPVHVQHIKQMISCTAAPAADIPACQADEPGHAGSPHACAQHMSSTATQAVHSALRLSVKTRGAKDAILAPSSSFLTPADSWPHTDQNTAANQHQDSAGTTLDAVSNDNRAIIDDEASALPQGRAGHETGVLRRKPGRGESTLSMSCSDKLARWGLLGLQGCLPLELLAEPLYLTSIHVGVRPECSAEEKEASTAALQCAISGRMACLADRLQAPFQAAVPQVCLVPLDLEGVGLAACADRPVPAGMSINWTAPPSCSQDSWRQLPQQRTPELSLVGHRGQHEVTLGVSGRKAGAPKTMKVPGAFPSKILSRICPAAMLELHLSVVQQAQWQALDRPPAAQHMSPECNLQHILEKNQPNPPFSNKVDDAAAAEFKLRKIEAIECQAGCVQYQGLLSALKMHPSPLEQWTACGGG